MTGHAATPRRLALVFSSFGGGGIQFVMLHLADGLIARGVPVDLVVVDPRGPLASRVPAQARLVDLGAGRARRALSPLVAYLRRERPTAMLSSQTHLNLIAMAARVLARGRTRLVVSEHVAMDAASRQAPRWWERRLPVAARLTYPWADGIVVVSDEAAARFCRATGLPRRRVNVIHNPVVGTQLPDREAPLVGHPWLDSPDRPVVLSAGRLTPQKDHETLLRAFALLRRTRAVRLIMLGEGAERARLHTLARQLGVDHDVAMPGFVLDVQAWMARANVFVLSSRWEGFGNVLVEAMACGTPVVSTDCPSGPAEILEHGRIGRLVAVGEAPALARAIGDALDDPGDPDRLRARALDFSIGRAVDQYLQVLCP